MPHLRARNLSQRYTLGSTELEVLRGVELDIDQGEVVFLRGASGAGKSTLLYTLAGLERPISGEVFFEEKNLLTMKSNALAALRNEQMGFIFQSYFLLPELTALENVQLPASLAGHSSESKAKILLERVGLSERFDHLPSQLSGGEQQRVAIARALINDPSILFADEPTGNLDAATGATIINLLLGLAREDDRTFIAVTHDPALAARGDRELILEQGKLHQKNQR